jgi:hypothetical protein
MRLRFACSLLTAALLSNVAAADTSFARPPEYRLRAPEEMAPTRAEVRRALLLRRAHNLESFRAYRKAGVYPHNLTRTGSLNVWLDREGHLCAAATMIDKDGKHELVQKTAETNNFIRLLDVVDGPVLDWILMSGFTIEEIDRIQAPMIEPNPEDLMPNWRAEEDARLRKLYAATDAYLVKHQKAGIESAVSRLMEHPELARKLLTSLAS